MLVASLFILDRLWPPDLARYRAHSLELQDRHATPVDMLISRDSMWRLPATPAEVSPGYLQMLLDREDRRFWFHPGVDPLALGRAAYQLITRGHIVSGGSTLTMQVARLLAPHRHSFKGKLYDIARAFQLEMHFSKPEILSMYLTLAPMGGNIEGVQMASQVYFGHGAAVLSPLETAMLVALPRAPSRLRPDRHGDRLHLAANTILAAEGKPLPGPVEWQAASLRHPPPSLAPHLAQRFAGEGADGIVATTLDARLQAAAASLAAHWHLMLDAAANIAMLVVDNRTREVLAYIGGADYFGPAGMVDMVRAERSPGSTLKPLIYALAFDDTLVQPDTVIDDEPVQLDGYAPRNFDRVFHGAVTVRDALQQSYNLPAVQVLKAIGPARFAAVLKQAGARLVLPSAASEPALPLALGGVGIDLEDLTKLYVGLANEGEFAPLRLVAGAPQTAGSRLLTRASVIAVSNILRGAPTPDGVSAARSRAIAYKTGTSYGFHDAWAAGYSNRYTAAVWVGRNDGSARPGAFGRDTAAPILFQLFDLLPAEEEGATEAAEPAQSTSHLAPALRHFRLGVAAAGLHDPPPPRILFPPAGATLDSLDRTNKPPSPVSLEAAGGRPPYRWLIDGLPLPSSGSGRTTWAPSGAGFVRISVVDQRNDAVSEIVRIQ